MANVSPNLGTDDVFDAAVDDETRKRADLVTLIRDLISDEIAKEADILLSERPESWTPLSLIAEAERRYLEKNYGSLDAFAQQQMNSRIVVDVD